MDDADISRTDQQEDTISLLDLLSVLVRRRWLIIVTTLIAAVLILTIAVLSLKLPPDSPLNFMPNYYRPVVKVMLRENGQSIRPNLRSTENTLSFLMGGAVGKDSNLALAEELLTGNTIKDKIIEEFDFLRRYELERSDHPRTTARNIIKEALQIESGDSAASEVINIFYQDTDPVFAARVLSSITGHLEERFRELTLERVWQKKEFIEERLRVVSLEFKDAQNGLAIFQLRYGLLDINPQVTKQIELISQLRLEIIQSKMEIQSLEVYLPPGDARILRLRQEIENKSQFIAELRSGGSELTEEFIPQDLIPELMATYLDLKGEVDVQKAVYTTLRQEYETVKIDEANNSTIFQLLEAAEVPEIKAGPSRSKTCIIVTIAAFFLAVFWAFVKEYFVRVKRDPVEAAKLDEIKAMLSLKKRK
ncbi:MAG TPA: hypothetical protein ENI27_08775 [bacterium]|nr:hypothetical protein [bacterium]